MKYYFILILFLISAINSKLNIIKFVECQNSVPISECPKNAKCVCRNEKKIDNKECEDVACLAYLRDTIYIKCRNGIPVDPNFKRECCETYECEECGDNCEEVTYEEEDVINF